MTREAISDLVARGEGSTMEFKRSLGRDLGRELCAFANADGGTILIGVSDAGEMVGVADHNRLKSRVQSIARSADPAIVVEVESVGEVLRVVVPSQGRKPYSFGGRFFMREGASSQQMSNAEVEDLFYAVGRLHFDKTPCEEFALENDLDEEIWAKFSGRAKVPEAMDRVVALRNLGLLDGQDRMTHAGAWFLARDVRRFTTSAHVSCALFMGTEKVRILDRRDFYHDIPTMIDDAVAWILTKINVEFIIEHVQREERPELPEEALREAVANAVAHRDYRSTANAHIYIFKDRVEILSPGGLPEGMTEADLGVKSMPRNPLLFGMLYRMGVVENIGSGIRRIRELCREHGVAVPTIEVSEHWITVTFPRPVQQAESIRPTDANAAREEMPSTGRGTPEARPESIPESKTNPKPESGTGSTRRPESGAGSVPRPESRPESDSGSASRPESESVGRRVLVLLGQAPMSRSAISNALGHRSVSGSLKRAIHSLMADGLIEYAIPEKPNSRLQEYRLTERGRSHLEQPEDGPR